MRTCDAMLQGRGDRQCARSSMTDGRWSNGQESAGLLMLSDRELSEHPDWRNADGSHRSLAMGGWYHEAEQQNAGPGNIAYRMGKLRTPERPRPRPPPFGRGSCYASGIIPFDCAGSGTDTDSIHGKASPRLRVCGSPGIRFLDRQLGCHRSRAGSAQRYQQHIARA